MRCLLRRSRLVNLFGSSNEKLVHTLPLLPFHIFKACINSTLFHMDLRGLADFSDGDEEIRSPWILPHMLGLDTQILNIVRAQIEFGARLR